jgi:hypothetical protein
MHTLEPTPNPESFTCKALAWAIGAGISFGPWILLIWGAWNFHWSVGVGFGLFGYLLAGVISSKIRHLSVPFDQREISFSTYELARWFVVRYLMCGY